MSLAPYRGTGIPGVIALGSFRGGFGRDFVAVYGHRPGVVVDLDGAEYRRLLLTVADPSTVASVVEAAAARGGGT
jgi:hypothetical protein